MSLQRNSEGDSLFRVVADPKAICKCCGAEAPLLGVVDFSRNCAAARLPEGISGIPIYYYRCPQCQFMFTKAFDEFTPAQFQQWVYNADYAKVDPDYAEVRPKEIATGIEQLMGSVKTLRILDYGAGSGLCASILRGRGFSNLHCFDPFVSEISSKPDGKFDCIFCIEVLEHCVDPRAIMEELASMLDGPESIILLTTMLPPPTIDRLGLGWWYVGPRNGHVSLFSGKSLDVLVAPLGLKRTSYSDTTHMFARQLPAYTQTWQRAIGR